MVIIYKLNYTKNKNLIKRGQQKDDVYKKRSHKRLLNSYS